MDALTQLDLALQSKSLLKHSFYQAWHAGSLTRENLQVYAAQYFHHVLAFPRYISATHSNCSDLASRQVLLENLIEEEHGEGHHPGLWLKFGKGLGLQKEQIISATLFKETAQLIDTFLTLSRSSYAEGIGALYAYERQVPEVAASKIEGLKKHYAIDDADTLLFFKVHLTADVKHSSVTRELLQKLSLAEREQAEQAAHIAADALWNFLSGVQAMTIGNYLCQAEYTH